MAGLESVGLEGLVYIWAFFLLEEVKELQLGFEAVL
jgi:hypothetical protein